MMADSARWLALARAPGLHLDQLRDAGALAAPQRLVGLDAAELAARGIPTAAANWLARPAQRTLESDRRWLESAGVALIGCHSERFPPLLGQIPPAPVAGYLRGDAAGASPVTPRLVRT